MKSCPTCNRTYSDDSITFCLVDGSIHSAPYEPDVTQPIRVARLTNPPPTEILVNSDALPPTIRASIPLNPPAPHPAPQLAEVSPDQKSGNFKRFIKRVLKGIMIGAPAGFIIVLIINLIFIHDKHATDAPLKGAILGAILGGLVLPTLRALIKFARK